MLHHQLTHLINNAASVGRDGLVYCRALTRATLALFSRFDYPTDAFEEVVRQARVARARERSQSRDLQRVTPLLIHYHIFKNAGTSFEWALQQAFGDSYQNFDTVYADGFISRHDLARYARQHPAVKAIASHQAAPPAPRMRRRHVIGSILIRDPIARIRSIYSFERTQPTTNPGSLRAKELDFKEYVRWRLAATPGMLCNFQVLFCTRNKPRNPPLPDRFDLEHAVSYLERLDIIGTVERYNEWLGLAQAVLGQYFPSVQLPCVHHNSSSKEGSWNEAKTLHHLIDELGQDLAAELLEKNELDMSLHQIADGLLTRRLAENAVTLKLRDAYGKLVGGESLSE